MIHFGLGAGSYDEHAGFMCRDGNGTGLSYAVGAHAGQYNYGSKSVIVVFRTLCGYSGEMGVMLNMLSPSFMRKHGMTYCSCL